MAKAKRRKLTPRPEPRQQPPPSPEPEETIQEDTDPPFHPKTLPEPAAAGYPNSNGAAEGDDDDVDVRDPDSIEELLSPFNKEQLVEILRDAAVRHVDVLGEVYRVADADPTHRRIFVHGLGWDTNSETLTAAFTEYGEIEDCKAVIDRVTGKSKGYGFVLFKHRSGARRALEEPQKKIGNRMTACQLASSGPVAPPAPPASEYTQRKVFVSNVGADLDPQKLLQFFSQFGEIEEGPMGLDKVTGKPKGFCLFVYKTIESAKKVLEDPNKKFEGHTLFCQKAIDGPKPGKPGFNRQTGGAYHSGMQQGTGGVAAYGSQFSSNDNSVYTGGMGSNMPQATTGHLMAPPAVAPVYNQAAPASSAAGLNPALGQALTTLLTQGAGLGLTNLLGAEIGGAIVNQLVQGQMGNNAAPGMQGTYGNPASATGGNMNPNVMGGYGVAPAQGGYGNVHMGQPNTGRYQQGKRHMSGNPSYMGH